MLLRNLFVMKKTVKQYLEEIPQLQVRTRALKNTGAADLREWATDQAAALKHAFVWHRSPEGFGYWCDVYLDIFNTQKNTAV